MLRRPGRLLARSCCGHAMGLEQSYLAAGGGEDREWWPRRGGHLARPRSPASLAGCHDTSGATFPAPCGVVASAAAAAPSSGGDAAACSSTHHALCCGLYTTLVRNLTAGHSHDDECRCATPAARTAVKSRTGRYTMEWDTRATHTCTEVAGAASPTPSPSASASVAGAAPLPWLKSSALGSSLPSFQSSWKLNAAQGMAASSPVHASQLGDKTIYDSLGHNRVAGALAQLGAHLVPLAPLPATARMRIAAQQAAFRYVIACRKSSPGAQSGSCPRGWGAAGSSPGRSGAHRWRLRPCCAGPPPSGAPAGRTAAAQPGPPSSPRSPPSPAPPATAPAATSAGTVPCWRRTKEIAPELREPQPHALAAE